MNLEERFGHWGEHPDFPLSDWKQVVEDDNTRLGYWAWVENKIASLET